MSCVGGLLVSMGGNSPSVDSARSLLFSVPSYTPGISLNKAGLDCDQFDSVAFPSTKLPGPRTIRCSLR